MKKNDPKAPKRGEGFGLLETSLGDLAQGEKRDGHIRDPGVPST